MAIDFREDLILRWPDGSAPHIPLLKQARVRVVVVPARNAAFEQACATAGIETLAEADLKTFTLAQLPAAAVPGPYAALATGLWPGLGRGASAGRDDEASSASSEPWVDSNGYWIAYLQALYPKVPVLLAYQASQIGDRVVPFDTLTLALLEARVMGGNYILSMDPAYRKALLAGEAKAVAAWKQLGTTAAWLSANRTLLGREPMPMIEAMVEPGRATAEIANLLFRRNGSPKLTAQPPAMRNGLHAVVTTAMRPPAPEVAAKLLALASQGVTVVTDDVSEKAWWKVPGLAAARTQDDRVFYRHGKGTILAYKRKIVDPSEHALDVIDVVTHPRRAVRIWNAPPVIAVASPGVVHLLNYGTPTKGEIQARIQGVYGRAVLHRPGLEPKPLEASRRGTTTEVFIPEVTRLGTVVFHP